MAAAVLAVVAVVAAERAEADFAAAARAVVSRVEFLTAAARAAAVVVFFDPADRGPELAELRSIFSAGSATTSTVAAALSAAAFDGARVPVVFFAGALRAGVFFGAAGAASAT